MATLKQRRLAEILQYSYIGEEQFQTLQGLLAPIADSALRRLIRESAVPASPLVEGVRQEDYDELERTLTALQQEYEASDEIRALAIRDLVITAKDHARFASRSAKDPARRAVKEEMVKWMLIWLENPGIFGQWVRLRRRAGGA